MVVHAARRDPRKARLKEGLSRTFEALADLVRLAVVRLLRRRPRRSSDIAEALALNRPATSKHLEVLRQAGLVEAEFLEEDSGARVHRLRRPERCGSNSGEPRPLGDLRKRPDQRLLLLLLCGARFELAKVQ